MSALRAYSALMWTDGHLDPPLQRITRISVVQKITCIDRAARQGDARLDVSASLGELLTELLLKFVEMIQSRYRAEALHGELQDTVHQPVTETRFVV